MGVFKVKLLYITFRLTYAIDALINKKYIRTPELITNFSSQELNILIIL